MVKLRKLIRYIFDYRYRFLVNASLGRYNSMSDTDYIKNIFKSTMGYELDLEEPKTFNEKLQWLKLHNRLSESTAMVDKYLVRDYIANKIGEEYLIPLLGVWENSDEIDFSKLPDKFVLKCNHNSGLGMCICKDKSKLDFDKVRKDLNKGLRQDYYLYGREWPYKNVKRRIIAEKYMEDGNGSNELTDYKFHCFNGFVDSVMVCSDRASGDTKFYFFDKDWNLKRYNIRGKNAPENFTIPKPDNMDEMFSIAEKLSQGLPFVRVDLYSINNKTYFGELTFYPQSGFDANLLKETDEYWGNLIDLSIVKNDCD